MRLYARLAGIEPRTSHLPVAVARLLSLVAAPTNPGQARILKLMSLADNVHPERFDGAAALEQKFGARMTTLEAFVGARVAQHLQSQRA